MRAQYHLRQTLVFLDAHALNKPEVMIGQMHGKVDVATGSVIDEKTATVIRAQLMTLAEMVRRTG